METKELQTIFLDGYYNLCKFQAGCNGLQTELDKLGLRPKAEVMVGKWIVEDSEFKAEFEKAKRVVERVQAERAQDFLSDTGQGKKKKDDGITNANVVAAHMVLEAFDKDKWGQKVQKEKVEKKDINVIIKHYGKETEVIECPEVKVLPSGE